MLTSFIDILQTVILINAMYNMYRYAKKYYNLNNY